jgi:hypothetical protein
MLCQHKQCTLKSEVNTPASLASPIGSPEPFGNTGRSSTNGSRNDIDVNLICHTQDFIFAADTKARRLSL